MKEAYLGYDLEQEFRNLDAVDQQLGFVPYFEFLYKKLHSWSYKYGFHAKLHNNRFYRWWGNKFGRYDASRALFRHLANEIRNEIDKEIIEAILREHDDASTNNR